MQQEHGSTTGKAFTLFNDIFLFYLMQQFLPACSALAAAGRAAE